MTIPYFDADAGARVQDARPGRRPGHGRRRHWRSVAGAFYGMWRDNGPDTVVPCEGAMTWSGTHAAGQGTSSRPPTGGRHDTDAGVLPGRPVVIPAFDGDPAGRTATEKADRGPDRRGCTVLVGCARPPGPQQALRRRVPTRARRRAPGARGARGGASRQGERYWRFINGKEVQVSDWTFVPSEIPVGDSGISWRGTLLPAGTLVTIRSF